jgi:hypothetical protein
MISCSRCNHDEKKILIMKVIFISFQANMYVYLVWWMCCVDVGCQSVSPKQQVQQVTQMQERQEAYRKHQFMFASTSNRILCFLEG